MELVDSILDTRESLWLQTLLKFALNSVLRTTCTGTTGPEWASSKLQSLGPRATSWLLAGWLGSWTSRSSTRAKTEVRNRKLVNLAEKVRGHDGEMDSVTAYLHKPDKTEILFFPSIRPQRLRRPALQPAVPASARPQAHLCLPGRRPHNNHAQRRAAVPVSFGLPAPEQHLHQDRWEEKKNTTQRRRLLWQPRHCWKWGFIFFFPPIRAQLFAQPVPLRQRPLHQQHLEVRQRQRLRRHERWTRVP